MQTYSPYFQQLMYDVKNMRVKHVRKMFVLLREVGVDLKLNELQNKTDWSTFSELNTRLNTLVVQHGITLGEFATAYVLNIQSRQRGPTTEPRDKNTSVLELRDQNTSVLELRDQNTSVLEPPETIPKKATTKRKLAAIKKGDELKKPKKRR
jgi:hypothetical protein